MIDKFRTALSVQRVPFFIDHRSRLLLLGSCFTEHIGGWLAENKFPVLTNPFGIVYNPGSITACLERLWAGDRDFEENELFEHAGLWHSWEHHGQFSRPGRDEALAGMRAAYAEAAGFLKNTSHLLLTFGTADVFVLPETGRVVANNHKVPADRFGQRRLSATEIVDGTVSILEKIRSGQPGLQVILTVSPVRHLRNGAVANQRSKATLVLACEEICRQLPFAGYFPAYELLLDDLRDYRFYAPDMVHPSDTAVDYIREFFASTFFSENTRRLNGRIGKIVAASHHRPFHPETAEHRAFAQAQLATIEQLRIEAPELNFEAEIRHFNRTISGTPETGNPLFL